MKRPSRSFKPCTIAALAKPRMERPIATLQCERQWLGLARGGNPMDDTTYTVVAHLHSQDTHSIPVNGGWMTEDGYVWATQADADAWVSDEHCDVQPVDWI